MSNLFGEIEKNIVEITASFPRDNKIKNWWRNPLVVSSRNDSRFDILPELVPDHLLPTDLLVSARSVIVFFLPFKPELTKINSKGARPDRQWGRAYVHTNRLIGRICKRIAEITNDAGYASRITPATHNFDEIKLMSRWSHKHLGHLSGLGRFGVNSQLITPKGCAGRLGSIVTEADFGDNPLVSAAELCLHKSNLKCLKCVSKCPVNAINSDSDFDRGRCWNRLKENISRQKELKGLPQTTHVCGKCVASLPCTHKSPIDVE